MLKSLWDSTRTKTLSFLFSLFLESRPMPRIQRALNKYLLNKPMNEGIVTTRIFSLSYSLNQQFSNSSMQQNHLVKTQILGLIPRLSDSVGLGWDPRIGIHDTFPGGGRCRWLEEHTLRTTSLNAVLTCSDSEHILARPGLR